MATKISSRKPLQHYLGLQYPFNVIADEDGGYVVLFPDLPGCMTQIEDIAELAEMTEDARRLWIETEYERGVEIPEPSYPEKYSGKFNLRIPRSLHHRLAESAEREGVSLNQYVTALLEAGDTNRRLSREVKKELDRLREELHALHTGSMYEVRTAPTY
ncbi:MAG TPA: toxin-antitoxin system HicB family antitoxin [Dehalococcoidia bacterium]|jgi:antitoxin HicB|nr:toxin-antitoxin system HicB family antitoxin [Dehalococcoidia bacterium]